MYGRVGKTRFNSLVNKAFRNEMGREFSERPKVLLCCRAGEVHTAAMMLQPITNNDRALLHYVFPSGDACVSLDIQGLFHYLYQQYM